MAHSVVQAPEISVTRCYSESNSGGSYYDVFDARSGRSDNTIGGESVKVDCIPSNYHQACSVT
jgi:hypothetical protein